MYGLMIRYNSVLLYEDQGTAKGLASKTVLLYWNCIVQQLEIVLSAGDSCTQCWGQPGTVFLTHAHTWGLRFFYTYSTCEHTIN